MKKQYNYKIYEESANLLPHPEKMVEKIYSQKKISVGRDEIMELVLELYQYIRYFNSIKEYQDVVFGSIHLEDVKVPKEFADFIVPTAIKFDPTDLRSKNLSVTDNIVDIPNNYFSYVNLCDRIRGIFKKDFSSDCVSLAELKKSVSLVSIIDRASNLRESGYVVNYGSQVYYPVRMTDIGVLYEARHFNATESDLLEDYLADFRF